MGFIGLAITIAIVAAVAAGLALVLDVKARSISIVLRSLLAGIVGALISTLPAVFLLLAMSNEADLTLMLIPVFVMAGLYGLLVGFPAALFVSRRRARKRAAQIDPTVFD